ncbi:pseudaminic acid synthase [Aquincola tertiaricarbonis]|uniref:Pseudaminic acid synthase n=1 Tax=Aquincola tertiaricarbonis TaxID=391953 RepID=A0ABY4S3F1_AQUTE|nr:pseudaminic acid synthase [Aquincola tertiaricarbonis]URI06326.1 pseudaminic acid synthase [Aquincola tertiaricarbonis]
MSQHPSITIAGRPIGINHPPYVVAEMSANHNGSLERALHLLEVAQQAGADAVKIQSYTADTITLPGDTEDFIIRGGLWDGRRLHELYREAEMPWDWHAPLFAHARKLGITLFSSPFDRTAVDLLESLDAPAYKIASFEAVDLPLIRYVASTGKPMIISTGMANAQEVAEAVQAAREGGCRELAVLRCVSGYPAAPQDYNLRAIPDLVQRHGVVAGLSDHTLDDTTAIASVALGAALVEKHYTLDRNGGGPDDAFSLEPAELARLCRHLRTAWQALGVVRYGPAASENGNVKFRRSVYFVKDLAEGEVVTEDAIRVVRPGYGAAPKHYEAFLGKRMRRAVARYTPAQLADVG